MLHLVRRSSKLMLHGKRDKMRLYAVGEERDLTQSKINIYKVKKAIQFTLQKIITVFY